MIVIDDSDGLFFIISPKKGNPTNCFLLPQIYCTIYLSFNIYLEQHTRPLVSIFQKVSLFHRPNIRLFAIINSLNSLPSRSRKIMVSRSMTQRWPSKWIQNMQKYVKSYHSYVSILKNTQFMNFYNVIILLTYIPTYLYTHNAVLLRSFVVGRVT